MSGFMDLSLSCLSLMGGGDETGMEGRSEQRLDPEVESIEEESYKTSLKLSEEEINVFISDLEADGVTPSAIVNALAVSCTCYDPRCGIASLKACIKAAVAQSKVLGDTGACSYLVKLMNAHGINQDVALRSFGAIIGLCQSAENLQKLEASELSAQVIRLFKIHNANADIVTWGINAIMACISLNAPVSKSVTRSLIAGGIVNELMNVIDLKNVCSSSSKVVESTCHVLMQLYPINPTENVVLNSRQVDFSVFIASLDRLGNIVTLDGEPITPSVKELIQRTREHFHEYREIVTSAHQDDSNASGSGAVPPEKVARESLKVSPTAAATTPLKISKADLLYVITTIISDSVHHGQKHDFSDIFNPTKKSTWSPVKGVASLASGSKKGKKKFSASDEQTQSKFLAFQSALSAALSDEEDALEEEQGSLTDDKTLAGQDADLYDSEQGVAAADTASSTDSLVLEESKSEMVPKVYPLRAESHHSIRFDVPVSLVYTRSTDHQASSIEAGSSDKLNPLDGDRSTGNLYFADMQYTMGMSVCAPFFDTLSGKSWVDDLSVDESTSSSTHQKSAVVENSLSEKDMKKCKERFRLALSMDPEHCGAMYALGVLLCTEMYNSVAANEEAEQLFKDIIALRPSYPKAFYNLGHLYYCRGQFGDALDCFRSALEIDTYDLDAEVYKSLCLTQLGGVQNISDAMDAYKRILSIEPNHYLAQYNLGVLLASLEDYSGAINIFQGIILNEPEHADTLAVLAKAFMMRADANLKALESNSKSHQDDTRALPIVLDDLRRALRCYEQLLRLDTVLLESVVYDEIVGNVKVIMSKL